MKRRKVMMLAAMLATAGVAGRGEAQVVGMPVLQNAFANPGLTIGLDWGTGAGANAYGIAGAWAPTRAFVQVSGGVALHDPDVGSKRTASGLRIMAPIPKVGGRNFGVAGFVGVGALRAGHGTETLIPIGASVAYRRALGATRGVSIYAAPFYSWSRFKQDSVSTSHGLVRFSVGVDAVVVPGFGLTVGYEGGARAHDGEPGPAGGLFGVGVSYALHRPR
ncbi:MAG TPA: hypothetical protein VF041_16390 [Gemmatimonadaceae bacterium]